MLPQKNLVKKNLISLRRQQWYLQRFDAAPFFITAIGASEFQKERRKWPGGNFTNRVVWFGDQICDWYISQDDINRISELLFRKNFKLKKIAQAKIIKHLNDSERQNKLARINLPGSLKQKWYWQPGDVCLSTFTPVGSPDTIKEKYRMDGEWQRGCLFFKDDLGDWYHNWEDLRRTSNDFMRRAKQGDTAVSKRLIKLWREDEQKFFIESKKLAKVDFTEFTDVQIKRLFVNYLNVYRKAVSSSSLIDGFALGTDETLQQEISAYLDKIGQTKNKNRYFTLLTAPVTQSFINEAEISLLNVGLLIKAKPVFKNILIKSTAKALADLDKFSRIKKALLNHSKNYFWVKNNYFRALVLTSRDFLEEIRGLILGGVDLRQERDRIINTPKEHKKAKARVIKKINLPQYLRILLTISEDFTWWQDERKKKTFWLDHYSTLFLQSIARRTGYTLDELGYLVYPEIIDLLSGHPTVTRSQAQKRRKACWYYQKGDRYEIVTGHEALALKEKIFAKQAETKVNDFRGMPASRGKVRGRVKKVLSVREIGKVEKGDILVAVMTRPDYVPAIKKAAAVITDEGGVTCHAAIVSRELGVPCVIGTKIATRVLNDGDIVDVNASHGVVTIIKRS